MFQGLSDPTTQLLIQACAKISQPGAWTQHAFARLVPQGRKVRAYDPAATCWCSSGVCMSLSHAGASVLFTARSSVVQAEARLHAWTRANHGQELDAFNDTPGRTQAEVVAMFEAVIAAGPLPHQVAQASTRDPITA